MKRAPNKKLGEKVIYLAILSFDKYPKRDVRTLTPKEKANHVILEHRFRTAQMEGKVS